MSDDYSPQSIYDELNRRGVFTQDAEAQAIGHELRRRGAVVDPTQGGLMKPSAPVVNAQGKSTYMPSEAAGPTPGASPFNRTREMNQQNIARSAAEQNIAVMPKGFSKRVQPITQDTEQNFNPARGTGKFGSAGTPKVPQQVTKIGGEEVGRQPVFTGGQGLADVLQDTEYGKRVRAVLEDPDAPQWAKALAQLNMNLQGFATPLNVAAAGVGGGAAAVLPKRVAQAGIGAAGIGFGAPIVASGVNKLRKGETGSGIADIATGGAMAVPGAMGIRKAFKAPPRLTGAPAEILNDFQQTPQEVSDVPAMTRRRLPGTTGEQPKLLAPPADNAFVVDAQGNAQRSNIGNLQNPDVLGRPNAIEKPSRPTSPFTKPTVTAKPSPTPAPEAPVSTGEGQAPPRTQGEAALGATHPNERDILEVHPLTGQEFKNQKEMQDAADTMNTLFPGSNAAVQKVGKRNTLTIDKGWETKSVSPEQKPNIPKAPEPVAETPQKPNPNDVTYDTLENDDSKRAGVIRDQIQAKLDSDLPAETSPDAHAEVLKSESALGKAAKDRVNAMNKAAMVLSRSASTWADKLKARKVIKDLTSEEGYEGTRTDITGPQYGRRKGESEGSFAHRIRIDFSDTEWGNVLKDSLAKIDDLKAKGQKPPEAPPSAPPPEGGGNIPVEPTPPVTKGPENAVQVQKPDESVLRQEGPQVGLQGVERGNSKPESTPQQGQTQGKTKPLKGENGPTPSIQRRIILGAHGARTVVFPDEWHAGLFDYAAKMKKAMRGDGPYPPKPDWLSEHFGMDVGRGMAHDYNAQVTEGSQGVGEEERFAAPEIKPQKGPTIKKSNPRRGSFDASILEDVARAVSHGAQLIGNKVVTFAKWSGEMVKEFGETIRPHLVKLWDQSHDAYAAGATKKTDETIPPNAQARIDRLNAQTGKPEQKPTRGENIGNAIKGAWMAPSAWQTIATPFHAVLRHGLPLTLNHPGMAAESIGQTWKAFASKEGFSQVREFIDNLPTKQMADHFGVADTGQHIADPTKGEEDMIGNAFLNKMSGGKKIPVVSSAVGGLKNAMNANHRGFVTYLDLMAQKGFAKKAAQLEQWGITPAKDEAAYRGLAGLINNERGRGSLGPLENQAALAAAVMYAPRLQVSRIALMNPVYYAKMEPGVRRIAVTDAAKGIGVAVSAIMAAKAAGADVSTDPRDSNFLKMKIGNRYVDPLGGFRSYVPLVVQSVTGQKVVNGQLKNNVSYGESRGTVAGKLFTQELRKKFSPSFGMAYNLSPLSKDKDSINRNAVGDVVTPVGETTNLATPFFGRDLIDYFKHNDIGSTIAGEIASQLGASSYEPSVRAPSFKSKGLGGANMKSLLK